MAGVPIDRTVNMNDPDAVRRWQDTQMDNQMKSNWGQPTPGYTPIVATPVAGDTVGAPPIGGGITGGSGAKTTGFNTQSLYDAQLAAKKALIDQNYNSTKNALQNAYDTNKMEYGLQEGKIGANYDDSIKGIQNQTYRGLEQGKVLQANRGIMNSAMGTAQGQGMVRAGNDNMNQATRDRDMMLNDLTTRINNLTKGFGNDMATLEANKGSQLYGAQNEALSAKLGADMDLYKFDTDWANQFTMQDRGLTHAKGMQDDMQEFTAMENNLDRNQQWAIAQLNSQTQLKASQISAGAQRYAANLASQDRAAAQQFIEKQWAVERQDNINFRAEDKQDAINQSQINYITSRPDFNPLATQGVFTGGALGASRDADVAKIQNVWKLQGWDQDTINTYTDAYLKSSGLKTTEGYMKWMDGLFQKFESQFK